jgi:hypothetical protein
MCKLSVRAKCCGEIRVWKVTYLSNLGSREAVRLGVLWRAAMRLEGLWRAEMRLEMSSKVVITPARRLHKLRWCSTLHDYYTFIELLAVLRLLGKFELFGLLEH